MPASGYLTYVRKPRKQKQYLFVLLTGHFPFQLSVLLVSILELVAVDSWPRFDCQDSFASPYRNSLFFYSSLPINILKIPIDKTRITRGGLLPWSS